MPNSRPGKPHSKRFNHFNPLLNTKLNTDTLMSDSSLSIFEKTRKKSQKMYGENIDKLSFCSQYITTHNIYADSDK